MLLHSLGFLLAAPSVLARPQAQSPTATATATSAVDDTASNPTVTLDYCTLVPTAGNASLGYYKYQNIRFAAVPTGDLRWAEPQWPSTETAINNGSLASESVDCSSEEDCLYMDIWAPANSANKSLPVMVWTYGGGFTGGSKSQNTPEGLFNLTQDFVFVAYNYRLGLTGLAVGPTFSHEGGTSNVALWDVQHAFHWTKKYISNFGGNPDEITAVGFSAGASQTLFQMTRFAGRAEQLYNRAYVMSPGFVPGAGHHHAEAFWQNVSKAVGCPGGSLDCMRQVDFANLTATADDLVDQYTYQFQPRVDGDFVSDTYEAQFYQNRFNFTGPVVITHELHEANGQAYTGVDTTADVAAYLRLFFPAITDDAVARALALYPESDYASPGLRFADMKQSFDLTAHDLAVTRALGGGGGGGGGVTWNALVALGAATHGTDQDYYWYSTYTLSSSSSSSSSSMSSEGANNSTSTSTSTTGSPPSSSSGPGGSNSTSSAGGTTSSSVNATVAVAMQKYLLSFVLTGDPNAAWAGDRPAWPPYTTNTTTTTNTTAGDAGTQMVFNDTLYLAADDLASEKSVFWNKALWY